MEPYGEWFEYDGRRYRRLQEVVKWQHMTAEPIYEVPLTDLGLDEKAGDIQIRLEMRARGLSESNTKSVRIEADGWNDSVIESVMQAARFPDLVVSVEASPTTVEPGDTVTISATVRNQGNGQSAATTVRIYSSSDEVISTNDTEIDTGPVSSLSASRVSGYTTSLTAPSTAGTYYYGACVDPVSGESRTGNNCSQSVRVTVSGGSSGGNSGAGKMYWTDGGTHKIQRANLDGSGVEDLVTSGLLYPDSLALDLGAGKMYWTDGGTHKIQRANLDGSGVQDLITSGLSFSRGLSLDLGAGKMYWTDFGTDKIQRANLDGSGVEDLVTSGLDTPIGLALDPGAGKMYWMDSGTDKIQRANLDGSGVEDLVTSGLDTPIGLALDPGAGKMYWMDSGTKNIQRANLDGSGVEDLVTSGLDGPNGLALDLGAGKMYWTDYFTDKIQRANLDGSGGGRPRHLGIGNTQRSGAGHLRSRRRGGLITPGSGRGDAFRQRLHAEDRSILRFQGNRPQSGGPPVGDHDAALLPLERPDDIEQRYARGHRRGERSCRFRSQCRVDPVDGPVDRRDLLLRRLCRSGQRREPDREQLFAERSGDGQRG